MSIGEAPADLLLVNGKVINTFSAQIEEVDIAIYQGVIAGLGKYHDGKVLIDLKGRYVTPGFIDGHIHLESSFVTPTEYAKAVVPRGVLAVVTDFHEIANVCGRKGIEYILRCSKQLPLDIFGMIPSCVPATHLESSGVRLDASDMKKLMNLDNIVGLGEMMNFPGVIAADLEVWKKIELFRDKIIDGHAPGLKGNRLNAYLGAGIHSDHECTTMDEALEKLKRGMHIMIREGTSEKNLEALLPLINPHTLRRCLLVVDDRSCVDLQTDGDVDAVMRKAILKGIDPVWAIQMATINPAEYFRLNRLGAVAPGYYANLVVLDDFQGVDSVMVFYRGKLVAEEGRMVVPLPEYGISADLLNTVKIKSFDIEAFKITSDNGSMPVIQIIPDQIITKKISHSSPKIQDGYLLPNLETDILKLVVVERHRASGNIGLGWVKGFGLKRGALASSVAHDSHNIIAVGLNDDDIYIAIKELERMGGGLSVVSNGRVIEALPLPIAGLLSDQPLQHVVQQFNILKQTAATLGCIPKDPFAVLSFLALPVIPELRLTDMGLVDVMEFKLLD